MEGIYSGKVFIRDLVFVALIPLVPIAFELLIFLEVGLATLCLTCCMYPLTVGVWSTRDEVLYFAVLVSVLSAMQFGYISSLDSAGLDSALEVKRETWLKTGSAIGIFLFFVTFIIQGLILRLTPNLGPDQGKS